MELQVTNHLKIGEAKAKRLAYVFHVSYLPQ